MSASVSLPRPRRLSASRCWCGVSLQGRPIFTPRALLGDIARVGTGCQCRCRLISYCSKRRQGAPVVWPSGGPSCGCELRLPPPSADRPTPPAVCHASHPCRADCAPTSCSAASPVRSRLPDIPSPVVCGSSSHRQAPTHRVRRRGSLRLCRQRRRQAKPTSSFTAVGAPCIGRSIASMSPPLQNGARCDGTFKGRPAIAIARRERGRRRSPS